MKDNDEPGIVFICRGPERGCTKNVATSPFCTPCDLCYTINADDPRSTEEIMAAMNATH